MRRLGWIGRYAGTGAVGLVLGLSVAAQTASTVVLLPVPLLGPTMGAAVRAGDAVGGEDPAQADPAHAAALSEAGLQRFSRAMYGKTQVEAMQFNDVSGARAAYSLYLKDGAVGPKVDGASDTASVDGKTIVRAQSVVLIAEAGASMADVAHIVGALPKISGARSQPPLLPTLLPVKGLVAGSARYALGPVGYAASGGALPAEQLGWEKSGEAVTAQYADRRGRETLTLLLYPTPQIAGDHTRALEKLAAANGSSARVRREGELVLVAQGSFSADDSQNLIENIHLHNEVSFDKPMPLQFPTEIRKTYSLMKSIAIFSGVGGLAAVLLGMFLGFGRATLRKMQGKDAATDAEFLSLHLDPQNERPKFGQPPA